MGDVPKINCETCHQGAYAPYYGAHVVDTYPALTHPTNGGGTTAQAAFPPQGALPAAIKSSSLQPATGPKEASLSAPVLSGTVAQSEGAAP
jgi:photosynthetic reaction center cytochrome c subunit